MAALVPDTANNNKSTNKLDAEGLSCLSAIGGGAGEYTTYVHADPANFRALVQKLTGAASAAAGDSIHHKPDVASRKRQKLQERRRAGDRLEIDIGPPLFSTSNTCYYRPHHHHYWTAAANWSKGDEVGLLPSPISTMDSFLLVSSASPTPAASPPVLLVKEEEEEERAITEREFYLHPSPGRNKGEPPKLLSLFPLHSPKNSSVSSSE